MAMDFKAASGRVRSLLAAPPRARDLQSSALTKDDLRDNIIRESEDKIDRFKQQLRQVPEITRTREDGTVDRYDWTGFPEALRDIARAGFGWDEPEVTAIENIKPSMRLNHEVVRAVIQSDEFNEERPYTRNSELESCYGAMAGGARMKEIAQTYLGEHIERAEQMGEAEQQQQSAQEMMDQLRQQAKQDVAAEGSVGDGTRRAIKKAMRMEANSNAQLQSLLQAQASSSMVADAIRAGQEVAKSAGEAVDALSSVPGMSPGTAHNLTAEQQLALAEEWRKNRQLMDIAKMLGRMIRSFRFKRNTRTRNVNEEPVGVTTGDDLKLVLPTELARAGHPALKALFAADYAEGSLLMRDMRGRAPAGKGPIIVIVDGSGSMHGQPFVWATSLALTLLSEATRTKRDFCGIEFGSQGQLKTWMFPKSEVPDPREVLDYASHFFGGGTDTASGFAEALRVLEEHPAFSSADIVLIGDGCDYFSDRDRELREAIKARNVRIHGLTILTGANPYFDEMCEWHMDVRDLAGANGATDQLAESLT